VKAECNKNKLGKWGRSAVLNLSQSTGQVVSDGTVLIDLAEKQGLIRRTKGSAWIYVVAPGYENLNLKFQGASEFVKFVEETPPFSELIFTT
jgi:hypothetical protein